MGVKKGGVKTKPSYKMEKSLIKRGYTRICGVDEVGMSCIAGPVVAAAVVIDPAKPIKGLNDSKLLTPEERNDLFCLITERSITYGIGLATVEVINSKNIYWASRDAMISAISKIIPEPDFLLIDGNQRLHIDVSQESIVKGDTKCNSIAAASILAKVSRDRIMEEFHNMYSDYGWITNKGYPTEFHRAAIAKYGLTPLHRINFRGVVKPGAWKPVTFNSEGKVVKLAK
jgi:ribonuclease HII